jgi:hypothetical protein
MTSDARQEHLREVLDQITSGHAILFLGAGSSRLCRRPDGKAGLTGKDLAREILSEINDGRPPPFDVSLMKAAEFYTGVRASARRGLDRFLCERLQGLQPTIGHLIAASFPWRAVVTTNYNRVVEEAWERATQAKYAAAEILPVRTDDDLTGWDDDNGAIPLYKPHGCISLPGQGASRMVVTSVDYFHSETLRAGMFDALRTLARECTTVFIGYSLDDFTFRNIFYTLHAEQGDWSNRAYSVGPIADPLYLRWLSRAMERNFNTTVVDDTFDGFMVRLAATRGPLPAALQGTVDDLLPTARADNAPYLTDPGPNPAEDSP